MNRTQLREAIFLILFRECFYDDKDIKEQAGFFLENEDCFSDDEKKYITDKVCSIVEHVEEIDNAIGEISIGWKVSRMSKVDLTILRQAYYEIVYDDSVPLSTAINEAVELAKNYGGEKSAPFVNGILAKVKTDE